MTTAQHRLTPFVLSLGIVVAFVSTAGGQCPHAFQRGDANQDDKVDLSDPISTLGYLFLGSAGPGCHDAADADDNGKLDLSDAVYAVGYLFLGGAPIPPPTLDDCGLDPTADELGCIAYEPCGAVAPGECTSNECCDPGSFCAKEINDCDGAGTCARRPEVCPLNFDPVCGCDGVTYSNSCAAASAGVNIVHRGECGNPGACLSDEECDAGSFCERPEGLCDDPGRCAVKPEGCEKIFDPVCGCDGATYGNRCDAARQGVSVAYAGECVVGRECASNGDCDFDQYCERDAGRCDDVGECALRPDLCLQVFDPVCGCDGLTYTNACVAAAGGVSVASTGPCGAGPECRDNEGCDPGSYCSKVVGFCDESGVCVPDVDPAECAGGRFDPVCGCDNRTYDNDCLARAAGVGVQRFGACEDGAECESNDDCSEEHYCSRKEGFCAEPGICVRPPAPVECDELEEFPVCGCDDQTYRNECAASAAGISVAYPGACDGLPRCSSDKECDGVSFCRFREGFCAGLGMCEPRPQECPEGELDPVCGCDGITYVNECLASNAGVSVSFRGKCDGGSLDCETSANCGQGLYCAKADGDCDGAGACVNVPTSCDEVFDPVCGCDGITYPNACQANAAGVNVLAPGECP